MSVFAGILNFDGAPVDPRVLDGLASSLVRLGPDGGGFKQAGNFGVVFGAFHTDAESKLEKQPLVSCCGQIIAWDGRLDNRAELVQRLWGRVDRVVSDVEIVTASYLKWGLGFLPHLIGDFALLLWEAETRTLVLARDAFGTRPLYYSSGPRGIVWSSDLAALLDLSALPLEIDREYIATYLCSAPDLERTAYRNVLAVRPGFALIVCDGRIEKREFWRPGGKREIRYQSDSEYEEHFCELFRVAVSCRLRSAGPVWAELSGGLDSSSIVCMADRIKESATEKSPAIETVSYVYDNSPASDERRFIAEVEALRGRAGHHFHEDESVGRFLNLALDAIVRPNPTFRFTARHDWVRQQMQETGSSVLLSGIGGDNLLWSGGEISPYLADLLVQLKLTLLHHQVSQWSRTTRNSYVSTLWRGAVLPGLAVTPNKHASNNSSLIDRNFAEQIKLVERNAHASDVGDLELPSARAQASMLASVIRAVASCYYRDRVLTEYRFPFLHRPLVEFLFAIPIDQKLRPGENRSLQRRALKHLLPAAILTRQSKRTANEALCRTLAGNWREVEWLFKKPRVCEDGFVDAHAFAEAAKRIRHGLQDVNRELLSVLSVELWLRALESRKAFSKVRLAS